MKELAIGVVVLVIGVVVGGLGPRGEARALQTQVDELADAQEAGCNTEVARQMGALVGAGVRASGESRPEPTPRPRDELDSIGDEAAEELDRDLRAAAADTEGLDSARTVLEARRAQARAALIEQADLDDGQLGDIDDVVADMNASLLALTDELTAMMDNGQAPTRRQSMVFAADALDTMIRAEDDMKAVLDDEQLDDIDDGAVDPFSYVSPELVDAFETLGGG